MNHSECIANLATALSQAQAEMPSVPFDKTNAFLKNRYATLGAMIETARPVLAKYGLAVAQIVTSEDGNMGIETVLLHASGEWISSALSLPVTDEKGKSNAQVAGSIITYLRRYSYAAILGLYADEDNDGNGRQQADPDDDKRQYYEEKPQQKPEGIKRPYSPERIQKNTYKLLHGQPKEVATADQIRSLQIKWSNILHHDDETRLTVASFILNRTITAFKDLYSAEVDRLKVWLKEPPFARQEAQAIIDYWVAMQDAAHADAQDTVDEVQMEMEADKQTTLDAYFDQGEAAR